MPLLVEEYTTLCRWMREHGVTKIGLYPEGALKSLVLGSVQARPDIAIEAMPEATAAAAMREIEHRKDEDEDVFLYAGAEGFPPGWSPG